jgi:hypothetical protein
VVDGFTSAWSTVAFVAFISLLCNHAFSATQYALFASLGTLGRTVLASTSGQLVDALGGNWALFFLLTALMVIPALVLLGGIPMKEAVGTSLLIIAFKSAIGFMEYLNHVTLDWQLMLLFTLAAGAGTMAGASMTRHIDAKHLQKGFGYFVLAVAIFVLIKR